MGQRNTGDEVLGAASLMVFDVLKNREKEMEKEREALLSLIATRCWLVIRDFSAFEI